MGAASLDAYSAEVSLPPAHSTNRGYGWFALPPESDTDVLYVGDPAELVPYFRTVRPVGEGTWLLTGRTQPWAGFWPGLRHLGIV